MNVKIGPREKNQRGILEESIEHPKNFCIVSVSAFPCCSMWRCSIMRRSTACRLLLKILLPPKAFWGKALGWGLPILKIFQFAAVRLLACEHADSEPVSAGGIFPIPILLALVLHYTPGRKLKRITQTATYAPYFISTVVLVGMLLVFSIPHRVWALSCLRKLGMTNPS